MNLELLLITLNGSLFQFLIPMDMLFHGLMGQLVKKLNLISIFQFNQFLESRLGEE